MWGIQQFKMRLFWLKLQSSVDAIQMWSCQLSHWDCCTLQQRLVIGHWLLLHNHNLVNTHLHKNHLQEGFPGAYESRVTAYGTKKATSLHSGRSVMTHDYVARPVQEVMHSFCSCSCSDVVTTLLINCCRYWTYHEMTTTRLIPPGLLSLYRLHTWPLNRA